MAKLTILLIALYLLKTEIAIAQSSFKKPMEVYEFAEKESYTFESEEKSESFQSLQDDSESDGEPGELTAADIREAQNTDVGNFTTNSYHYYDFQGENMTPEKTDECSGAFLKCMQSIPSNPPMICGMHHLSAFYGFYDFYNYCELFLWNCMKGSREYRAVSTGHCYWHYFWHWGCIFHLFGWCVIPAWEKRFHFELYAPGDPLGGNFINHGSYDR